MLLRKKEKPREVSWFRALISREDPPSGKVIQVYQKDIRHYTDAVLNARALVDQKKQELEAAKETLKAASESFIEYCGENGLQLPIAMELGEYPKKTYVFQE